MTVRQHLQKAHSAIAEFHQNMSKCHNSAMSKEGMGVDEKTFHKSAAAAHDEAANVHTQLCDECLKAAAADELAKSQRLVPTNVSAVTPTAPGIRAVPRAGQRVEPEKIEVEPEFAKLISIEEDE